MTMINPEPIEDDELPGTVDLDRGEPDPCVRISSTLGASGAEIRRQRPEFDD